jgi:hypothetical protein
MIERVRTVGFKGFDIDEPVPNKVIYCGKNKTGKSTRANAISIALYGYLLFSNDGKNAKKPGDILSSFGTDHLVVAVTIKGTEFARKFSVNAKGGVTQVLQVDGKRTAADNFLFMLKQKGGPKIADIAEFMKQSEAKKVDTLFELYPNPELSNIDTEIEKAKEDVSRIDKKIKGAESTVQRLTDSKTKIELPPGSIAEIQNEIKSIDTKVADLEKQINEANINQAKIEGEKKGKKEAENEIANNDGMSRDEAICFIKGMSPNSDDTPGDACIRKNDGFDDSPPFFLTSDIAVKNREKPDWEEITKDDPRVSIENSAADSIKRVIGALTSVGCNTCAALIVAKQELKKYV